MAGGTNSYKVNVKDGRLTKELVSYHPKYANRPDAAMSMLLNGVTDVMVAPADYEALRQRWEGQHVNG